MAYEPLVSQNEIRKVDPHFLDSQSLLLEPWQLCDIELLLNGGFAPLEGFMSEEDYENVLNHMRLANGKLYPIPITLDISEKFAKTLHIGDTLILKDPEGVSLAIMHISSIWTPDKEREAIAVFGTNEKEHPGVHFLIDQKHPVYIGGNLISIQLPTHYNFLDMRHTPTELKNLFKEKKWQRILGFQTRNPMHQAHVAMTLLGSNQTNTKLLIHPVVGITKADDIDYITRVTCYEKVMPYYPENSALLSLLPLAMRMAGPREAMWHALIRRNYGCTHFLIGRDHAGCANTKNGKSYYTPYEAHELVKTYQNELQIEVAYIEEMVYLKKKQVYITIHDVQEEEKEQIERISGCQLRQMLREGAEIPKWFSYPEVIHALKESCLPNEERGLTIFLTGLSGSGKSTIANLLSVKIQELTHRIVTVLDGDRVRIELAQELGFSKEDRATNILRIGYVASEINKHRGIVICAQIAPNRKIRRIVREKIAQYGTFVEVYLSTPIEICEARDRKGLYARARAGKLKNFTGIDDPYEAPMHPEIAIDTATLSPEDAVEQILSMLFEKKYLRRL